MGKDLTISGKNLKEKLDNIDEQVDKVAIGGYYLSRKAIICGKWKKGKEIGCYTPPITSYYKLEKETGRRHGDLKKWFELYEQNKDYGKWLKEKAEPQAKEWTRKALESAKAKQITEGKQNEWFKVFNIWSFQRDVMLGQKHSGNIPGQIAENVLHYFTNETDLVVDPFGGGGSTIDACEKHKRKCLAYDIKPVRDDIIQHDIINGFPKEAKNCDLIFLDPPYWSQKKKDYIKTSLSSLSLKEFNNAMDKLARDCSDTIKENGYVSLIIGATQIKDIFIDHAFDCYKIFNKYFKPIIRINVPYSTEQYSGNDIKRAKDNKQLLNLYRDLVIYQK